MSIFSNASYASSTRPARARHSTYKKHIARRSQSGARPPSRSEGTAQTHHASDEPPPSAHAHWHEVLDLAQSLRGEKAGDRDVRVGQVELLRRRERAHGSDPVVPPAGAIEQRREQTRPVERAGQYQSIVPSTPTSAALCMSPTMPCSTIGRYPSGGPTRATRSKTGDSPPTAVSDTPVIMIGPLRIQAVPTPSPPAVLKVGAATVRPRSRA